MNSWINYHHLLYFKTIAEEGSVSKAAEVLRLGQPTLSAQLKQLEDSLGVMLFERKHKRLIITEQGKIALDYAIHIFKLGSEMFEVLNDSTAHQKLSLHIGSQDNIAKQIILQLVQLAFQTAPCQVTLSEGKCDELIRELMGHRIDMLVMNFLPTVDEAKALHHRVISKKNVSIFGAPKFKYLRKDFPASISGVPFIVPTHDSKLRFDLDHWAKNQKIELNIIVQGQDIAMKKLMAVSELGLLPSASHTVNRQVLAGELIEIGKLNGVYEELILVTANRKIENKIAAKLMESFIV